MSRFALIIGNSDGIGLALTRTLLSRDWQVTGISRSESDVENQGYSHIVADVQDDTYPDILHSITEKGDAVDLCVYCAGIGELFDINTIENDLQIFEVNLSGMIKTVACIVPAMVEKMNGQFIGLSSVADELLSPESPSYHASKAGFSNYLESLSLALRPTGVRISNIRFGFVDTKMAKGDVKPFMMTVDRAVEHVLTCIRKKQVRYTAPGIIIPLVKFRRFMMRFSL